MLKLIRHNKLGNILNSHLRTISNVNTVNLNKTQLKMDQKVKTTPKDVRRLIRAETYGADATAFSCPGYKQANLAIVPSKYAEDFYTVAKGTKGALPILYKSKVGEFSAGPLGVDIDVRTDLMNYNVIENGVITKHVTNLLDYDLSDYVVFYIGCSFSFYGILIKNNIITIPDKDKSLNVAMYKTNIDIYKSGVFNGKMVISMRYIKKEKLSDLATLTFPLDDVHGAPVHYGNPALIGINVDENNLGSKMICNDGEVAAYFCCGVSGAMALKSANLELAFSHKPGNMLITDVLQEDVVIETEDKNKIARVIEFDSKGGKYSVMSVATLDKLNLLDKLIQQDPGNRGIANLVVEGDFAKATAALSHADSVALITGFPCNDSDPPDETDGLPGIISLGAVLQALGKQVTVIVEESSVSMYCDIFKNCLNEGLIKEEFCVKSSETIKVDELLFKSNGQPFYDVVLASERIGKGTDGRYYGMKGKDLSHLVDPKIDDIFQTASECSLITTIGIGDGGNELGMGKVIENIKRFIPGGEKIGCVVSAKLLISAGVSNWGCYSLGLGLYALRSCPMHDRYFRRAVGFPVDVVEQMGQFLPTVQRERKILEIVESFGIKDGIRPDQSCSVDSLFFDNEHTTILKEMINVVKI